MQRVPAIHGGDPDPTAALPQEAGGGRVWGGPVDCGGERFSVSLLQPSSSLRQFFVLGLGATP